MKIIVATNNQHKIEEIKQILGDKYTVSSLKEENLESEPEENGKTFEENATIKAKALWQILKSKLDKKELKEMAVLADDSGLCVDALEGAPGVFSARFAGEESNDAKNNAKLLKDLSGVPLDERRARFVCSAVLLGHKFEIKVQGEAHGFIIEEEKGFKGFGYDPLFFSNDLAKTFAEATALEKNSVSHRGRALKALKEELKKR